MKVEPLPHFILPLVCQAAGAANQAPMQIATNKEFLDQQPSHDRFARTGVVGEKKSQRLSRKHFAVDCRDLVGQRLQH